MRPLRSARLDRLLVMESSAERPASRLARILTPMKRILLLIASGLVVLIAAHVCLPVLAQRVLGKATLPTGIAASDGRAFGPIPGEAIEERVIELTATPQIRKVKDGAILTLLSAQAEPLEVFFSPGLCAWEAALACPGESNFSIRQTKVVTWHTATGQEDFFWMSAVETITQGSNVLFDARICPIHATTMNRSEVEIHYGLPDTEFLDAYKRFSGGPGFILGGCCVGPQRKAMDYVCDGCTAAYKAWQTAFRTGGEAEKVARHSETKTAILNPSL